MTEPGGRRLGAVAPRGPRWGALRVPVRWHWTAGLAVAIHIAVGAAVAGRRGAAFGLLLAVVSWASVLLHEWAHALAARALGARGVRITLNGLGGLTAVVMRKPAPWQDAVIAMAGPIASLILLLLCAQGLARLPWWSSPGGLVLGITAYMNLAILVSNLLPIPGLDGWVFARALWAGCRGEAEVSGRSLEDLVADLQSADPLLRDQAFTDIHDRYRRQINAFFLRRCFAPLKSTPDDLTQECFIKLFRRAVGADRSPLRAGDFEAFLFAVARNCLTDALRKHQRYWSKEQSLDASGEDGDSHEAEIADPSDDQLDALLQAQDVQLLRSCLRSLPERIRCVLILWADGMSHAAIGDALGLPATTVNNDVSRGKRRLAKCMTHTPSHRGNKQ